MVRKRDCRADACARRLIASVASTVWARCLAPLPSYVTSSVSRPTGFAQQGAAGFMRWMRSVSTWTFMSGLLTVAKLPNVFGCVALIVNMVALFAMPVIE